MGDPSFMLKSYGVGWGGVVGWWGGGLWDFSVSPRLLGFGFRSLGFGARSWQFNFYTNTLTSFCKQNAESIRHNSPDQSEAKPCIHWPMRGWGWPVALIEGNKSPAIVLLSSHTSDSVIDWPYAFKYPWTTRQCILGSIIRMKYAQSRAKKGNLC